MKLLFGTKKKKKSLARYAGIKVHKKQIEPIASAMTPQMTDLASKEAEIEDLKKMSESKDSVITALTRESALKESAIYYLKKDAASREAQLNALTMDSASKDNRIYRLKKDLEDKGALLMAYSKAISTLSTGRNLPRNKDASKDAHLEANEVVISGLPIGRNLLQDRDIRRLSQFAAVLSPIDEGNNKRKARDILGHRKQSEPGDVETSSTGPHEVLVIEDVVSRSLSYLGLAEFAAGARTCRAWSESAKSVGNAYWRTIAHSRWPEWATRLESEAGTTYDFRSACKEQLRTENHRLVEAWLFKTIPGELTEEYKMCHGKPKGVPLISWLSYQGHIFGDPDTLSLLSHSVPIPVPIFRRYENAARKMYEGTCNDGASFEDLLPVPSNITDHRWQEHDKARNIIRAMFFKSDGSLMDEIPKFGYRDEAALYYSGSKECLTPIQVLAGIEKLRSMERS